MLSRRLAELVSVGSSRWKLKSLRKMLCLDSIVRGAMRSVMASQKLGLVLGVCR